MSSLDGGLTFRRLLLLITGGAGAYVLYLLRGVLAPLFFAFLLAYALDPLVDRLERARVPRALAACLVMLGIAVIMAAFFFFAVPLFLDELRDVGAALPAQLAGLQARIEPWLATNFKVTVPHTFAELSRAFGGKLKDQVPTMLNAGALALFGTLGYVAVALSALIVPVFALYLLIDFDRIVARFAQLVPRRWAPEAASVGRQIHSTLGGYVRGQITANIVLAALYALGLRLVDIRLAVPIGLVTGMLAFVPYVGFFTGLLLALSMAILDWHGAGPVVGVALVMGTVQVLDALIVTPRIVGRSVGLSALEVLLTMSAAATLLGFFGVLLAVPLGAVLKILAQRLGRAYLTSDFYRRA